MPSIKHIHLIAPSSSLNEQDISLAESYFKTLGIELTIPSDLLGKDLLCANTDEARFAHLEYALNDPFADTIWLLRGGYGLTKLVPKLFPMKKPQKEKLFIGFSDGTALHTFLNQAWNWPTLHGPVATQIAKQELGAQTREAVLHIVKKGLADYTLPPLKPFNAKAKKISSLSGILAGGNLCILQCSMGTNWQFNSSDKILFFEDVSERGYRIDRALAQLQQAHIFEEAKAIIFGDFMKGNEADGSSLVLPVLQRFAKNSNIPVFVLPGCGHGEENFPLPFNVPLTFDVEIDK